MFKFCDAVKETVNGTSDDKPFVRCSLEHYRILKLFVRTTIPNFQPFEHPQKCFKPPEPFSRQPKDDFSGSVLSEAAMWGLSPSVRDGSSGGDQEDPMYKTGEYSYETMV